jgi:hypothetical protein
MFRIFFQTRKIINLHILTKISRLRGPGASPAVMGNATRLAPGASRSRDTCAAGRYNSFLLTVTTDCLFMCVDVSSIRADITTVSHI